MSQAGKSPRGAPERGVVHDLAERRRQSAAAGPPDGAGRAGANEKARKSAGGAAPAADSGSAARAARVAELKAQIAKGTYNPDPKEVAKKLLERGF